ncbi:MAG: LppX_LprAFG lipoprotein [Chloroflexota bacterium]|nr:LppX_LprAFG lipoprotein [Chloroflexota bacterium]
MKRVFFPLFLSLLLVLAACGDVAVPTPTPIPPTPTPSPEDWLERAVETWNELEGFHFALTIEERTIELDEEGVLSFGEAEGDVLAPDRMQAETTVQTPFGSTPVAFIAIGENQWLTNPASGEWEEAPPDMQVEVTELFAPGEGIGEILADMENVERLADEEVEDTVTVHLRGTLPGTLLVDFADDLPETVNVDMWIGEDEYRIHKLVITEPTDEGPEPVWTFLFSRFDDPAAIEPPF